MTEEVKVKARVGHKLTVQKNVCAVYSVLAFSFPSCRFCPAEMELLMDASEVGHPPFTAEPSLRSDLLPTIEVCCTSLLHV